MTSPTFAFCPPRQHPRAVFQTIDYLQHVVSVSPNRKQAGLRTDVPKIRTVEPVRKLQPKERQGNHGRAMLLHSFFFKVGKEDSRRNNSNTRQRVLPKTNRAEKENIVKHKQDDVGQGKQRTAGGEAKQDGVVKCCTEAAKAGNGQSDEYAQPYHSVSQE